MKEVPLPAEGPVHIKMAELVIIKVVHLLVFLSLNSFLGSDI